MGCIDSYSILRYVSGICNPIDKTRRNAMGTSADYRLEGDICEEMPRRLFTVIDIDANVLLVSIGRAQRLFKNKIAASLRMHVFERGGGGNSEGYVSRSVTHEEWTEITGVNLT